MERERECDKRRDRDDKLPVWFGEGERWFGDGERGRSGDGGRCSVSLKWKGEGDRLRENWGD